MTGLPFFSIAYRRYPLIARKCLAAFNCVSFDGLNLLADDTSVECFDTAWWQWASIAFVGIAAFCLGLPLATWMVARTGHHGTPVRRRLAHVLTWLYDDDYWFMESIDLLRKFLLTGVVLIAWPGTKLQLLFGILVCLAGLALHLRWKPFRDPACDVLQAIALLQV